MVILGPVERLDEYDPDEVITCLNFLVGIVMLSLFFLQFHRIMFLLCDVMMSAYVLGLIIQLPTQSSTFCLYRSVFASDHHSSANHHGLGRAHAHGHIQSAQSKRRFIPSEV